MTDTPRYTVGDTVILTDVNYKGPKTATVTKVGRTLVYVDRDMYGRPDSAYRIETGARNDNYQHGRIWTTAEYEERTKRSDLLAALRDEGVTFDRTSRIPTHRLEKILEVSNDRLHPHYLRGTGRVFQHPRPHRGVSY